MQRDLLSSQSPLTVSPSLFPPLRRVPSFTSLADIFTITVSLRYSSLFSTRVSLVLAQAHDRSRLSRPRCRTIAPSATGENHPGARHSRCVFSFAAPCRTLFPWILRELGRTDKDRGACFHLLCNRIIVWSVVMRPARGKIPWSSRGKKKIGEEKKQASGCFFR